MATGGRAEGDGAAVPVRIDSTTLRTSSLVIRPPPPVPWTWSADRSCSRRSRRTAGVIRASGSLVAGGADAAGVAEATAAAGSRVSRGPRSSLPAGPVATAAIGGAGVAVGGAGAAAGSEVVSGLVGAEAAVSVAPSSLVSMMAISALFGTVVPSSARISRRVPSNGDGTSAFTLSVMTSSRGSYLATWSPGCLSHFPMVPSATLSPSWGIVTFATFACPPLGPEGQASSRCGE